MVIAHFYMDYLDLPEHWEPVSTDDGSVAHVPIRDRSITRENVATILIPFPFVEEIVGRLTRAADAAKEIAVSALAAEEAEDAE